MSAGLPLPKQVFGHGFLLARGGEKMSKSLGNVVDPIALADQFGVDQLRYFFLREVSFGQDGSYSPEAIVNRCNAELANSFGNLAQRVLSFIAKNCDGSVSSDSHSLADRALSVTVESHVERMKEEFDGLNLQAALTEWINAVFACNKYVDDQAPWALRKSDPDRMVEVLATLCDAIRQLAIAIQPVVPLGASKVLDGLGIAAERRSFADLLTKPETWIICKPEPVFPRLELPAAELA